MVSWQRLLSGRLRDPLVGRDMLLGVFAGATAMTVQMVAHALKGVPDVSAVNSHFGRGLLPSIGLSLSSPAWYCLLALIYLATLSFFTGLFRRRWLGLAVTGLIMVAIESPTNVLDLALAVFLISAITAILTRLGLVATASSLFVMDMLSFSPPLDFGKWYAGRAIIALVVPLALLLYGFYVSLGGKPMLGSALAEE